MARICKEKPEAAEKEPQSPEKIPPRSLQTERPPRHVWVETHYTHLRLGTANPRIRGTVFRATQFVKIVLIGRVRNFKTQRI